MSTSYQPKPFDQDKFVKDMQEYRRYNDLRWDGIAKSSGTTCRTLRKYIDKTAYPKTDVFLNLCSMMGKDAMGYLKIPSQIGSQVQK